jgi:hypothetical protein
MNGERSGFVLGIALGSGLSAVLALLALQLGAGGQPRQDWQPLLEALELRDSRLAERLQSEGGARQRELVQAVNRLEQGLRRSVQGALASSGCTSVLDPEALAWAVAAQLRQASPPVDAAAGASAPPQPQPLSAEQEHALQQAYTIIDGALSSQGRWTRDEVLRLRELRTAAGGGPTAREAWHAVQLRIAQAINRDELVPEDPEEVFP